MTQIERVPTAPWHWFHKRGRCSCGWLGPWRWTKPRAMDDAITHVHDTHPIGDG